MEVPLFTPFYDLTPDSLIPEEGFSALPLSMSFSLPSMFCDTYSYWGISRNTWTFDSFMSYNL